MSTMAPRQRGSGGPTFRQALLLFLALTSSASGSPMKTPDVKQNPNPKQRYEITLKIDHAPGPFDAITGSVDYRVTNGQCVPMTPVSGATIVPERNVPLVLTRVSDNVYKGTVYADLFQDEDYYGMGVCHWELIAAGAELKIRNLDFSPSIFSADIKAGKPVTRYFSNRAYRDYKGDTLIDIGNAHREDFQQEASDTFSTTLTAEEKQP